MRTWMLPLALFAALPACDGTGGPDDVSETAPVLVALDFSPTTVEVDVPTDIDGTIDFTDVDGNLTAVWLHIRMPDDSTSDDASMAIDTQGATEGQIQFTLTGLEFPAVGTYGLEVWLQDAEGQLSPVVASPIEVVEAVEDTRPSVDRLTFNPSLFLVNKAEAIEGEVEFTDVDGDVTTLWLRTRLPDGSAGDEIAIEADVDGETDGVIPFTLPDLSFATPGAYALEAWLEDAAGQLSPVESNPIDVQALSDSMDACAALEVDCGDDGWCYNVVDTTCEYLDEHGLTLPECADIETTLIAPTCVSSVEDPATSLVTDETACGMVQFWSNPTHLEMDCRCPEAHMDERCTRPYEVPANISFGDGPRMRTLAGTVQAWRGTLVGREWYLPVKWADSQHPNQTMIFAIDLDTGDRRMVSGAWNDPQMGVSEIGTGDPFVQVMDLHLHTDGFLYGVGAISDIGAPKLWKIDPASGARTKIFDMETAADSELCSNFSTLPGLKTVQMTPEGWAMDEQGNHYFSMVNMPGPSIVKLSFASDGTPSCSYLTSVNDCPTCSSQDDIGTGYSDIQFDLRAFSVHNGKLYAISDTKLIEVDLVTGQRKLMSNAKDPGGYGAGPINAEGLGDRWTTWDPHRNVLWTVGSTASNLAVAVDLTTGNRYTWPCWHPGMGVLSTCGNTGTALPPGPLNLGGMVIDPEGDHDLFFAHDLFSIARYDTITGNSYTFSL